eukprot:15472171-Alexandrium_andersonii.AAC.1
MNIPADGGEGDCCETIPLEPAEVSDADRAMAAADGSWALSPADGGNSTADGGSLAGGSCASAQGGRVRGSPIADGEAGDKRRESGAPDARLCMLRSVLKKGKNI